jgi:hypothetical protein
MYAIGALIQGHLGPIWRRTHQTQSELSLLLPLSTNLTKSETQAVPKNSIRCNTSQHALFYGEYFSAPAQAQSWEHPRRLTATTYSIYPQLPSTSGDPLYPQPVDATWHGNQDSRNANHHTITEYPFAFDAL